MPILQAPRSFLTTLILKIAFCPEQTCKFTDRCSVRTQSAGFRTLQANQNDKLDQWFYDDSHEHIQ